MPLNEQTKKESNLMLSGYNKVYELVGSVFKHSNAIYCPKPKGNGNIRSALALIVPIVVGIVINFLIGGLL